MSKTKKTTAKKAVKDEKAEGDREVRREAHRQDAIAELPKLAGPDARSNDEEQYLHPEDMLRLLLFQSEYLRAEEQVKRGQTNLTNVELVYLKSRLEEGKKVTASRIAVTEAKGKLARFHEALEAGYEIKVKQITFDDETGLIRHTPPKE